MRKINILIFKEFLNSLVITYLAFFTIGFTVDFFDKIDEIYASKLKLFTILSFFIQRIPFIFSQINLYALLISCMVTLNLLSQHNEILSIMISGIKPKRIFITFAGIISIITILEFLNNSFIMPKMLYRSEKKLHTNILRDFSNLSDIFIKHKDGFIFIDLIIPKGNYLINSYFVKINKNFEIEDVYYAKVLQRVNNSWQSTDGKWVSIKNNNVDFTKKIQLPDNEILRNIITTTYQQEWLTLKDIVKIIRTGLRSGMNITPYLYTFVKKIGHLLYPLLLFNIVFHFSLQVGRVKKNTEIIFVGMIILLSFTVIESIIFKVMQSMHVNPIFPLCLIILILLTAKIIINGRGFLKNKG